MKKLIVISSIATSLITGCSAVNNMDEMKNTTNQMNKTTSDMSETTKALAEVTRKMSEKTNMIAQDTSNTYRDMRLDLSVGNGFRSLKSMNEANSIEQKMIAAAYYYASFEFQLWKNTNLDSQDLREKMYAFAMNRLFTDIKEYVGSLSDSQLTPPTKDDVSPSDNNLKNLYALAAMMHEVNPNQDANAKSNNIKIVTAYELIKEGLAGIQAERKGKSSLAKAPEYVRSVAQSEEIAVLLVQLRYNIMAAKSLDLISDIGSGKVAAGKMLSGTWSPSWDKLNNSAKIELAIKIAGATLEARNALRTNGYDIARMKVLKVADFGTFYKNMNISVPNSFTGSNLELIKKLADLLTTIRSDYTK